MAIRPGDVEVARHTVSMIGRKARMLVFSLLSPFYAVQDPGPHYGGSSYLSGPSLETPLQTHPARCFLGDFRFCQVNGVNYHRGQLESGGEALELAGSGFKS